MPDDVCYAREYLFFFSFVLDTTLYYNMIARMPGRGFRILLLMVVLYLVSTSIIALL